MWVYIYPWANRTIGEATFVYALINIVFRFLIWVLPVFGYLRYIDRFDALEYLQLKEHWRRGVVIGLTLSDRISRGVHIYVRIRDGNHPQILTVAVGADHCAQPE